MSWAYDLEQLNKANLVLKHHSTLLGYTRDAVLRAVLEMREAEGPMAEILKQRADECERSLEAILEYHSS